MTRPSPTRTPAHALLRHNSLWVHLLLTLTLPVALAGGCRFLIWGDPAVFFVFIHGWHWMTLIFVLPCLAASYLIMHRLRAARQFTCITLLLTLFWSLYLFFIIPIF